MLSAREPPWVHDSVRRCPVAVVRRAEAPVGYLAVGIRGVSRAQRYAAFMRLRDIRAVHTPESLAAEHPRHGPFPSLPANLAQALRLVSECAEGCGFSWGPIGSVGYQLAVGINVTNPSSDLDVLIRCGPTLNDDRLRKFHAAIHNSPARVDAVLESDEGAVPLEEYLHSRQVLIKTLQGPRLGAFTW